jgi:OmpA-OmpF porin, OOP family
MTTKSMLLASAAALAICGSVGSAEAGHFKGWYIGVEGGANWVQDWDFVEASLPTHTHNDTAEFETGWAAMATVGYAFHNNWRAELEVGYRANDLPTIISRINNGPVFVGTYTYNDGDGSLQEFTLMANVLYDIPLSEKVSLSLGAGVGADKANVEFGRNPAADLDQWRLAYQGIAGLNVAVGSRTELFVNYRYLIVDAVDIPIGAINGHPDTDADDFQKHTVTFGLRYDLVADEEPAPPVAPVAPMPPPINKQFIVFFGFNKCNITSEADAVLSEAASSAKASGSASISIVGHTDTVGSSAYNQKLSECRADAAKSNLVGKGIPGGAISTSGRGESELIVQTGDGVKEPQNRRATIDLK